MDDHGQGYLEVAYGTTSLEWWQYRGRHLIVQQPADLSEIGLPAATRFAIDRAVTLPWTREFFSCPDGYGQIVLGTLNENQKRRLMAMTAKKK